MEDGVLDHSLLKFEKNWGDHHSSSVCAGCLTSLKYSQRNVDRKEEFQQTISTQKSCWIHTKCFWKIHYSMTDFEWTVRDDFATVNCKSEDGRYFEQKSVNGHSAWLPQSINLALQNWMKMDFKKLKTVLTYVEHLPQVMQELAYELTFRQRLIGGWKKSNIELFPHEWLLLKIKKRKMDRMNADRSVVIFSHWWLPYWSVFCVGPYYKMYRKRLVKRDMDRVGRG